MASFQNLSGANVVRAANFRQMKGKALGACSDAHVHKLGRRNWKTMHNTNH